MSPRITSSIPVTSADFGGTYVWIVAEDPFYSGSTSAANVYYPAGASGFFDLTQMPAQVFGDGGIGGAGSTIGTFLVGYSGLTFGGPGGVEAAQVITIDDPLGANGGPFFSGEFVVIGDIENVGGGCAFPALSDAPQAGTDALIEVNDRRALDAVWRDDGLWMVMSIDGTGPCDPAIAEYDQGALGGDGYQRRLRRDRPDRRWHDSR